jgi:hypothetical protein
MDWRIFFIGPMTTADGEEAPTPAGGENLESGDHFDAMVAAVVTELREEGYEAAEESEHRLTGGKAVASLVLTRKVDQDQVTLIQPHELFSASSISTNVFDAIDDADLVIADMSELRPAVVYELALAHALGIWTILLSSRSDADLMFYLRGHRHAVVDFSAADIRSADFKTAFGTWLRERNKRFDSGNPFTDFYGAPVPDISAASGLAHGYYENFLRRVLAPSSVLVDQRSQAQPHRGRISGVLVVRPANLRDLGVDLIDELGESLRQAFGDRVLRGERGSVFVDTRGYGDRTCEFVVDGWLIDVPRSVLTLERSPRLQRAARVEERHRAHDHLAEVLISRFLEVARKAVESDQDILRKRERFFYGSADDILRFLQRPPAERPTVWGEPGDGGQTGR